jgi:GNAT superfamily N-acetyltransferase
VSDEVVLRAAGPADAAAIAGVSVRAWSHAYADLIDPQALAERDVDSQEPRWRELLAAGSGAETWVAELRGRIAGYLAVGLSPDPDADGSTGMLRALYVDPPAQGAGLGTRLHALALERLRALGCATAKLWVFTGNEHGRGFYERHGWREDPSGPGNEGEAWLAPALRYAREL